MEYITRSAILAGCISTGDIIRFEDDDLPYKVESIKEDEGVLLLRYGFALYERSIFYIHDYATHINGKRVVAQGNKKTGEEITNTSRYRTQSGKQLYDVLADDLLTPEEFRGSIKKDVYKYVFRYEEKGGIASLEKAKATIDVLIAYERKLGEID